MENNLPLVSFIVPAYNVEAYIGDCIRSIMTQDHANVECVCVDDGSKDGTGKILDSLAKEYPKLKVIHQPNQGVSVARNTAMQNAAGEFLAFVDSDDALTPDFLDWALPCLDTDKDLDLWIGQRVVVDMKLNPCEKQPAAIPVMEVFDPIKRFLRLDGRYYLYCVWGKVFRRSVIMHHQLQFDESISMGEDALFIAEYYAVCRKVVIDDRSFGYLHSQREGSLVRRCWEDMIPDYMAALKGLVAFGKEKNVASKVNPLAAQWALGRFSVLFHRGYKNLWLRKYIVALCSHSEFKTTILDAIIKFGSGKYATAAKVMRMLPRWMLIEILFVAVCLNNLVRK